MSAQPKRARLALWGCALGLACATPAPGDPAAAEAPAGGTGGASGTGGAHRSSGQGGVMSGGAGGADTSSGGMAAIDASAPDQASAPDGDAAPPDAPAADPGPLAFTCTLVLGIKQTGEWFNAGFESIVDNARWEVVPVHNGHIELWADPKDAIWSMKPGSACAQGAANPDRVIFVGTNYDYTTTDEFVPKYTAVVANIQAKFPAVKRIELMTHVRAPGNVACPGSLGFKTFIKPAQEESIAQVVAKNPGLVFAAPKFEVRSCADYALLPHFTSAGAMAVAKTIGEHYRER